MWRYCWKEEDGWHSIKVTHEALLLVFARQDTGERFWYQCLPLPY